MQSTDSNKEREKQTFNIQRIQNSSSEITVNLAHLIGEKVILFRDWVSEKVLREV